MSFITYNRSQMNLFGYSVEDFARDDPKSRFVVELVSRLDLSALYSRYSSQGGDSYAPDMMLALWFYAYSNGITSTRKLEELCKYDTRYIYITGNQHPDHSTLSRFRKAHLDLLDQYFVEILLIAQAEGISSFNQIAIDGTKIKAHSSKRHGYTEDQLDKRIEKLRAEIKQYMQRCNFVEQGATDELDLETLRAEKERLERLEKEILERKAQLKERKKQLKSEHRSRHQINVKEPDARMMPSVDGPGYNAQLGVDMSSHLIVAHEVVSQPNDQGQFIPIQEQVEKNLGSDDKRSYTADSGYHNSTDLKELEEKQIDAVIADPQLSNRSIKETPTSKEELQKEERKLKRSDFVYHEQGDYYECPAGKKLFPVERNSERIVYRSNDCQDCPLINLCISSKKKVKQIHRSVNESYCERMAKKLQTSAAQERLKKRSVTVEPVFGNLKHNLGYRGFSLSGLNNVRSEFTLMCIGHNINVLFKNMLGKRLAAFIKASQEKDDLLILFSKNILAFLILYFAQRLRMRKNYQYRRI
ncbi:transposase IS4 family protein [Caldithrix abyssi DSM 13497]|uniref:Transposase IS4 family protein n=1 Tax=Caldithrix abyssi DSM 13497 TaxID=880073 RepID=H1XW31_CALAY|nr:IS1182 family transposase [Caldithrix abyssi]APF17722.1 Transposase domain (DUF772) [Caldithrix abyssi DSM 13497]EHO41803.1 transposase IS4 family protein [Caldithrix abyssi DSM 13497]